MEKALESTTILFATMSEKNNLFNWRFYIDGDSLLISFATPTCVSNISNVSNGSSGKIGKGYGSEKGKGRDKKFQNSHLVQQKKVTAVTAVTAVTTTNGQAHNTTVYKVDIDGVEYTADFQKRYINAHFPHHKSIAEINQLLKVAKKRKLITLN